MPLTRIHVNQHVIKANKKHGRVDPPLSVKRGRMNVKVHAVQVEGPCVVVYSPEKPLACGATVWIETRGRVLCEVWPASKIADIELRMLDRRGKMRDNLTSNKGRRP